MNDSGLFGALEAGGTKMVCAVGYADGTIAGSCRIDTGNPDDTVDACAEWFSKWNIDALGIGAFGPTAVDPSSPNYGSILETPKRAWSHFDLLGSLKAKLDVPMGYDTDVNAACLGEVVYGCARGLKNVVYLTIGTGVGAGVMVQGQLLHGILHPEAGHVVLARDPLDPMPVNESACPFHTNCLEGLIAGPAIAKRWKGMSASDIAGDDDAIKLLAGYLGQALVTFALCYAPQKIIIGGGVADNTPVVSYARRAFKELLNGYFKTPETCNPETYIVNNSLLGNQGIFGCFELARCALQ